MEGFLKLGTPTTAMFNSHWVSTHILGHGLLPVERLLDAWNLGTRNRKGSDGSEGESGGQGAKSPVLFPS